MKTPKIPRKLFKFKAAAARPATAEDYDDEMPSMRLSSALIVVGLLHVVAIGGIWGFNNIKTQKAARAENLAAHRALASVPAVSSATTDHLAQASTTVPSTTQTTPVSPVETKTASTQPAATSSSAAKVAKTTTTSSPASDVKASGQTYTVAKGDNPVTIAKKFKVPYDDLLKLNKIEDPRKLRIGQILKIPKTAMR